MYAKWLGPSRTAIALAVLTGAAVFAVVASAIRRRSAVRDPLGLEAALLLTIMPLVSPQGWDYVFLLATPAIALLVNYEDRLPAGWRLAAGMAVAIAAFTLFDIMGRRAYAAFMSTSMLTICFLVVVGALHGCARSAWPERGWEATPADGPQAPRPPPVTAPARSSCGRCDDGRRRCR